jgi:hypothetical protein
MAISLLPEKALNNIINKAFTKAMGSAKDPETKQKLITLRQEMLSLDKKAKKLKLKTLIKNAPEKDRTAAELKLRDALKKKNIKESVIYEADGFTFSSAEGKRLDMDDVNAVNDARRAQAGTNTVGEFEDLQSSLKTAKLVAIVASIVVALLVAALIYSVVKNIQLA